MSDHQPDGVAAITGHSVIPFIGRIEQMNELRRALVDVRHGKVKTVFVTGVPGVGKTRLVEEFVCQARQEGWQIWKGQADSIGNRIAFSSLMQALRTALDGLSPLDRLALMREFPYIGTFFPNAKETEFQDIMDVKLDRMQLFESLRLATVHLATLRPVIVWFDDLPESDAETIDWLHYFVRHEERARVMVIATFRTPVTNPMPEYQQLHSTLIRHSQLREVEVLPFQDIEMERFLKVIVSGDVEETALKLVQDRTRGVPLFAVEMLRMLDDNNELLFRHGKWDIKTTAHREVPGVITAVISARISHLSNLEQGILNRIAASDVPLPWTVLLNSEDAATETLADALSYLIDLGILGEISQGPEILYQFSHPMIREVVYSKISATALRQIHTKLASAWQHDVIRAAHHMLMSGTMTDAADTIKVLFEAGRHHLNNHAYGTAAEYFKVIVEFSHQSREPLRSALERDAKLLLAEAWLYTERVSEAMALLDELYESSSSAPLQIRVKRLMARVESSRSVQSCIRHIEDGLKLWDGLSESEDVFWMLNEQPLNYANAGDSEGADHALVLLRQYCTMFPSPRNSLALGLREAHAALYDWTRAHRMSLDPEALLIDANSVGHPEWIYDAHCLLGYHVLNQGDYESTIRYFRDCVPVVRRYGMVPHEFSLRLMGLSGLFQAGEWKQALAEAEAEERLAREYSIDLGVACVLDIKAVIFAIRGQWAKAQSCTKECKELIHRRFPIDQSVNNEGTINAASAIQILLQGDFSNVPNPVYVTWANTHGLPVFLKLVEGTLQIRTGQLDEASRLIAKMHVLAENQQNYASGAARFLEGLLAQSQGDVSSALTLLTEAIHIFDVLQVPLEAAVARLEYSAIAALSQPAEAEAEARKARTTFRRLQATPLVERAEQVLNKGQGSYSGVSTEAVLTNLSDREREIVSYVCEGLSTKQIAAVLVVSPRTITTHLERIYRKLGVHSRTALVHQVNSGTRLL